MANTFDGANQNFNNAGIFAILAETIKFRKQLVIRPEKNSQSGWNDALNAYMMEEIENLNLTVKSVTYHPDVIGKDSEELRAADTTISQADIYNDRALASDNTVMPAGPLRDTIWDLTGGDVDIPQLDQYNCPNDFFRLFISALDHFFVSATRLDSRWFSVTINKYESVQLINLLNRLYTITQRKGGELNRSDIPAGTLPSQEGDTFNGPVAHEDVDLSNPSNS